MIKFNNLFVAILIFLFFFITKINALENKILFKINNNIITTVDLLNEINYLGSLNNEFKELDQNKAFEIAKNSIIREKIKRIELKKYISELSIDEKYFDQLIKNFYQRNGFQTVAQFNEHLIKNNLKLKTIKQKITIEILWNELILSKFSKNIKIDKKLIALQLETKNKQNEFKFSEIIFNLDKGENLETKYQIIKETIDKENFSNAALIFSISNSSSNGGKLGWIKETSLNLKIKEQLLNLDINEYTKPIVIPGGFLILKIDDIKKTEIEINKDKEIERIIKEKTNEQLNQFSNIFFNKIKRNVLIDEL